MKKKVMLVALLCVLGIASMSIGNANAAPAFYSCTVTQTGANYWGYYIVYLTDVGAGKAFTDQAFFIPDDPANPGMNKAQFATALTAFANSTNVNVYADPVTTVLFQTYAAK
ncbi:MAG: hypothetical protein Q7I94_01020 [Candidatus Contubernalis sp.]|nr:hypothetical protein [Candidatus Contubernalis sp.]